MERLAHLLVADKRANPSNYAMVTISEGATLSGGEMVLSGEADAYGHRKLGGIGALTGELISQITGEGIVYQQVAYLMRSGSPDSLDLMVATNYAVMAADLVLEGASGRMVALRGGTYTNVPISVTREGSEAGRRRGALRRRAVPAQGPPRRRQADVPVLMHVAELWRHPVKSLQGERLGETAIGPAGLLGDREWGIRDEATGHVLTGRREPRLLLASATWIGEGAPAVTLPDGVALAGGGGPAVDEGLSEWLDRPVRLVPAAGTPGGVGEFFADATDDTSEAIAWTMPPGRFVDAQPLLLLTTAALRMGAAQHPAGEWDVRRFRPNVLVEAEGTGWLEDAWCGRTVRLGSEVVVAPLAPCTRCTMVTRPQPGLERDLDVFRALQRAHDATFGVWTRVVTPGVVRAGDAVLVEG